MTATTADHKATARTRRVERTFRAMPASDGAGVKVAVIDSGIDAAHPAIGTVQGYVAISPGANDTLDFDESPHDDLYGHGTACAGIIRALAPACELYSVRLLNENLTGRGKVFAAGLLWAGTASIAGGC